MVWPSIQRGGQDLVDPINWMPRHPLEFILSHSHFFCMTKIQWRHQHLGANLWQCELGQKWLIEALHYFL
jgi:hypothetical protein